MEIALSFIAEYLTVLYLIHIPAGFASLLVITTLGLLALTKYRDKKFSLEKRGRLTYRLWMSYSIFLFIVIPTASILATLTANSFLLYMALFLMYLNLQLIFALRGKHASIVNRVLIVIGLVIAYVMIGRGLIYAIQQQPIPATIVFFGLMLAILSTIDLTTIFRANRVGLIIRNGVGSTLAAITAMINIYVFRGELAWFSWILPTLIISPVIITTMVINDAYHKKNVQPKSQVGQRVLQNIIAFKDRLESQ